MAEVLIRIVLAGFLLALAVCLAIDDDNQEANK